MLYFKIPGPPREGEEVPDRILPGWRRGQGVHIRPAADSHCPQRTGGTDCGPGRCGRGEVSFPYCIPGGGTESGNGTSEVYVLIGILLPSYCHVS